MERGVVFSIIVVCLNPGGKLQKTLASIKKQTFMDYEVIIKDGMSFDGAPEAWEQTNTDGRIKIFREKDQGIYDAMNQAVAKVQGKFVYFLNCGDLLRDETVLAQIAGSIENQPERGQIIYGNIFEMTTGQPVTSNPRLNRFGCYRNVPCHQACFYQKELLRQHPFVTKYRVRADYEHFLWCALMKKARLTYLPLTIADYEGGGFSETADNRRRSAQEHREIVRQYMSRGELFYYRALLLLTLAPLRTALSRNQGTAAVYNKLKKILYSWRHK